MKKLFFSTLLFGLSFHAVYSQTCGFTNWPCPSELHEVNNNTYRMSLVFAKENSGVSVNNSDIETAMITLNEFYNPHNIYLDWNCKIYDSVPSPFPASSITVQISGSGSSATGAVVPDFTFTVPVYLLNTYHFAHELGHALGLLHTFNPLDNDPQHGDIYTDIDYPVGTDCLIDGDCVCDTEPDHGGEDVDYFDLGPLVSGADTFLLTVGNPCTGTQVDQLDQNSNVIGTYNPDYANIMSYYEDCQTHFTPGQGKRMRNTIKYCSLLQDRQTKVNPTGSVVWEEDVLVKGILEINSGETAYIGDAIEMVTVTFLDPKSKVVVNEGGTLILNMAHLTSCGTWKGIVLNGGKLLVSYKNNQISNAEIGISALSNSELVIPDDEVDKLRINNSSTNGIRAVDPDIIQVYETEFDDCKQAILLTFPTGNISAIGAMKVEQSAFVGNDEDLKVVSGNGISSIEIKGNTFSGKIGVNISGDNFYSIEENTFLNSCIWSSLLYSTGQSANNSHVLNSIGYSNNGYGIVAVYNNLTYQCVTSCFQGNGISDIIINGDFPHQGTSDLATGNCFSQNGIPDIKSFSNNEFTYWEPLSTLGFNQCVYSTGDTLNYKPRQDASEAEESDCNVPGAPTTNKNALCDPAFNSSDILNSISQINTLLANIDKAQYSSQAARVSEKAAYKRCLIKLNNLLADYYYSVDSIRSAVNVYESHNSFSMNIKGFFIYMKEEDYSEASSYLSGLRTSTTEETEFIQSSRIYLNGLQQGSSFSLDSLQRDTIYQAALKNDPLAAYSRSIWLYFTDEDIKMSLTLPTGSSIPRQKELTLIKEYPFRDFPNPATGLVNIEAALLFDEQDYRLEIYDINGNVKDRRVIDQENLTIDVSRFDRGVYFFRIYDVQGKFMETKNIILH